MFFSFLEDASWNAERDSVEFGVGIGEYEGVVRVPRNVFRRFIDGPVTPDRCLEAYHLQVPASSWSPSASCGGGN